MTDMPTMRAAFRTTVSGGGKYEMVFRFPTMDAMHAADDEWRAALPIPEVPASVEPVEYDTLIAAGFDDYAARCALRTDPDGVFCHAYFYSDGQWRFQTGGNDLTLPDGTILRCVLTKRLYARPEPDAIGSNFGNGGGLDPVEAKYLICKGGAYYRPNAQGYTRNRSDAGRYTLEEAISYSHPNGPDGPRDGITYELDTAPPSPGFGGGDLREALRRIASSKTELSDKSDYARGWNDARFTMGQIARQALESSR